MKAQAFAVAVILILGKSVKTFAGVTKQVVNARTVVFAIRLQVIVVAPTQPLQGQRVNTSQTALFMVVSMGESAP